MKIKYWEIVFWVGFCFWFIETAAFGFNHEPSCFAEKVCDYIAGVLIIVPFSAMIGRCIEFVKKHEEAAK